MSEQIKLRPEVARFAEKMEKQLQANEHKGGWKNCDVDFLWDELSKNHSVLDYALAHNNTSTVLRRCANIANFVMMIADNWGGLIDGVELSAPDRLQALEQENAELSEQLERMEKALDIVCEEIADHQCPQEFDLGVWPDCEDCPSRTLKDRYDPVQDITCWKRWAMEKAEKGDGADA